MVMSMRRLGSFLLLITLLPAVAGCGSSPAGQARASGSTLQGTVTISGAWALYPLLVTFVVIATANHFVVDVLLGALTAGVAAALAYRPLALARPDVWAFRHVTA